MKPYILGAFGAFLQYLGMNFWLSGLCMIVVAVIYFIYLCFTTPIEYGNRNTIVANPRVDTNSPEYLSKWMPKN